MALIFTAAKRAPFLLLLWLAKPVLAQVVTSEELQSAAASYNYVERTLAIYEQTGRIATGLGLDGADYAEFLQLLRETQSAFDRYFNEDSAMCLFYRERAEGSSVDAGLAQSAAALMPTLSARRAEYVRIDEEFQGSMAQLFGQFLLDDMNISKLQGDLVFELPIMPWEESEVHAFVKSACSE